MKDNDNYATKIKIIIDKYSNIYGTFGIHPNETNKHTNVNLKFILNTHHHHDHIGGNNDLKKKYGAKIVGFKNDKNRIPDIDILVVNNQTWSNENFEAKIIHIPGHTSGHICFYFSNDKIAFTLSLIHI